MKIKSLDGSDIDISELEAFIQRTLEKANVAGLSCAILIDNRVVYQKSFGFRDKRAGTTNDTSTIFGGASLSKAVFAYLVMLLHEEGFIDLDRPLYQYLPMPLPDYPNYRDLQVDERWQKLTARMALSHTTGFPNWRFLTRSGKLGFLFDPGARHSYSGEGIALLQMVGETITGTDLQSLAQERVFTPLGMTRSSYTWRPEYADNVALPHDVFGRSRRLNQRSSPDAAGSLLTTAGDYARLLAGILNATGKRQATMQSMLTLQVVIPYQSMLGSAAWQEGEKALEVSLGWGLGWGRFDSPYGRAFFHTGHDFGFQNYTVTYFDKGIGIVLLSNSDNFESVASEIARKAIDDRYSPFDWLDYIPFDPSQVKTPPPEPVAVVVDASILETYAGEYAFPTGLHLNLKVESGTLYFSTDAKNWQPALAESENRFFMCDDDTRYVFERDASGQVTHFYMEIQGLRLSISKVK